MSRSGEETISQTDHKIIVSLVAQFEYLISHCAHLVPWGLLFIKFCILYSKYSGFISFSHTPLTKESVGTNVSASESTFH